MLIYLCDLCKKPLDPKDVPDHPPSPGEKVYCPACKDSLRPRKSRSTISCLDCQVAVSENKILGRGIFDLETNIFCDSCERNPSRRYSPKKFRCNRCGDIVTIDDLRSGKAMAVEEKAYCSTCKRKMPETPLTQKPEPAPQIAAAPLPKPKPTPPRPSPPSRKIPVPALKSPTRGTGEVRCDLCSKTFKLSDLRSGAAQIKDSKVLCPRCLSRLSMRAKKFDSKYVLSLVFIIVIFPLVSAGLVILGFIALSSSEEGDGGASKGKKSTVRRSDPSSGGGEAKSPATAQPAGSMTPSEGSPGRGKVNLSREDMAKILDNLKDEDGPPEQPPPARTLPPKVKAETGEERDAGSIAAKLSHDNADVRLEGLMQAGVDPSPALIPMLIERLADADPYLRAFSAALLGRLKATSAASGLQRLIWDPDKIVRKAASRSLLEILGRRYKYSSDLSVDELDELIKRLQAQKKAKREKR